MDLPGGTRLEFSGAHCRTSIVRAWRSFAEAEAARRLPRRALARVFARRAVGPRHARERCFECAIARHGRREALERRAFLRSTHLHRALRDRSVALQRTEEIDRRDRRLLP